MKILQTGLSIGLFLTRISAWLPPEPLSSRPGTTPAHANLEGDIEACNGWIFYNRVIYTSFFSSFFFLAKSLSLSLLLAYQLLSDKEACVPWLHGGYAYNMATRLILFGCGAVTAAGYSSLRNVLEVRPELPCRMLYSFINLLVNGCYIAVYDNGAGSHVTKQGFRRHYDHANGLLPWCVLLSLSLQCTNPDTLTYHTK